MKCHLTQSHVAQFETQLLEYFDTNDILANIKKSGKLDENNEGNLKTALEEFSKQFNA